MCLYAITQSAIFVSQQLKLNPLDFADGDLVLGPVIKFGGPGRFMRSHLLGMLEPASILQVNCDAGRSPGAGYGRISGSSSLPLAASLTNSENFHLREYAIDAGSSTGIGRSNPH